MLLSFLSPLTFFSDPEVAIGSKCLEVVFLIIGLLTIYTGVKNFRDKENPASLGTGIFWTVLGIVMALGRWMPPKLTGALVIIMTIPAVIDKVKIGKVKEPSKEETHRQFQKIGMKIFAPALSIGLCAIFFAIFLPKIGALVGVTVGVFLACILLYIFDKQNKAKVFLDDSERLLSMVGPLSMLPQLLASLGAVFTAAGVGEVVAKGVGSVIPAGNVNIGIIVYALGMVLFTMIMGNAFAAITVMTVGVGAPFVLAYGANPVMIGMMALTCGYCGTLMTPMAANFNIVPVAMLDMKDRFGVIKNQVIPALIILVFQIVWMIIFK